MPELDLPFLGHVSIVILVIPFLYGPLAIWVVLRLAGLTGRDTERRRETRRRADRSRQATLLFWACEDCRSLTPEPSEVCYSCGAPRRKEAAATADGLPDEPVTSPATSGVALAGQVLAAPRGAGSAVTGQPTAATATASVEPPEALPAVAWHGSRLTPVQGELPPAPVRPQPHRRPRPTLTVVTTTGPGSEAIRGAERYLAEGHGRPRRPTAEEEGGETAGLEEDAGRLSAGGEQRARGAG